MIRKRFILYGALAGVLYTVLAMMASYTDSSQSAGVGRLLLEFTVFSFFTAQLAAVIGLGLGLLVEGLVGKIRHTAAERKP